MSRHPGHLLAATIAAGALFSGRWSPETPGPPATRSPVEITEWDVPWPSSVPRDPFADGRGLVWFVGQAGNYVAYLDPVAGTFHRHEIDPGTHPHNLLVDERGVVWYTGNANGTIDRLDPATGVITRYPLAADLRDPHTLAPDGRGNLWFTVQNGNAVGRLEVATGAIRITRLPTPGSRPYGIAVDSRGRPWFDEFGGNRIGTIDPAGLTLREYSLPDRGSRPRRIAITSDDRIWVDDYARGTLIRFDPANQGFQEWSCPSGSGSLPYAMTRDDRDHLWVVETGIQPNQLVGFDPALGRFFSRTPIAKSGGLTVRHMTFDARSRSLWFGTDANTIGRATLP